MTTSLELSKKLAEAGLKIETEKWWVKSNNPDWLPIGRFGVLDQTYIDKKNWVCYPAPSTDELLAVMPPVRMSKVVSNFYNVKYSNGVVDNLEEDKILPEALAKMILYLLSNGWRWDEEKKSIYVQ